MQTAPTLSARDRFASADGPRSHRVGAVRLVAILADKEDRDAASDTLVGIGKPAVADLIKGLRDQNQVVRPVHALGTHGRGRTGAMPQQNRYDWNLERWLEFSSA